MSSRYLSLKSGWMVIPFAEVANKARQEVGCWIKWRGAKTEYFSFELTLGIPSREDLKAVACTWLYSSREIYDPSFLLSP